MKNVLLLTILFLAVSSCEEPKQTKFDKMGVSFTCPKGWSITDQESIEGQGYYLAAEKDGFTSSGLVTFSWIDGEFNLNEWLKVNKETLGENFVMQNADIKFGDVEYDKYNGIQTLSMTFTASLLGVDHEGKLQVFHKSNKTFATLSQGAIEDRSENKDGFAGIEGSFKVE